jgi:hypothetical protein
MLRLCGRLLDADTNDVLPQVDAKNWDPSVKALTAFPSVLSNLDRNLEWTSKLGDAYYNQPQDVMSAVQTMRDRAYAAGTLRSTPQLNVVYQPGNVVIQPVVATAVYVPVYDPGSSLAHPSLSTLRTTTLR